MIKENFITLDELVHLYCSAVRATFDIELPTTSIHKLRVLGFIDERGVTTSRGEEVIAEAFDSYVEQPQGYTEAFENFWREYPKVDDIEQRRLKGDKRTTFIVYNRIAQTNKEEDIMKGLRAAKVFYENSPTRYKYMKGCIRWLEEKDFLKFLDEEKPAYYHGEDLI